MLTDSKTIKYNRLKFYLPVPENTIALKPRRGDYRMFLCPVTIELFLGDSRVSVLHNCEFQKFLSSSHCLQDCIVKVFYKIVHLEQKQLLQQQYIYSSRP
jgi:hypothetical protein